MNNEIIVIIKSQVQSAEFFIDLMIPMLMSSIDFDKLLRFLLGVCCTTWAWAPATF